MLNIRHELVDAQVEVLRMYLEKRSAELFLEALDRLIDCTCASFEEEEKLMECLTGAPDPVHREMHQTVLAQLELLRRCVLDSDRGHLLGQLILVDRQLTSHISDALQAPLLRSQARQAERDGMSSVRADSLMHH
jgi:hemerythrin